MTFVLDNVWSGSIFVSLAKPFPRESLIQVFCRAPSSHFFDWLTVIKFVKVTCVSRYMSSRVLAFLCKFCRYWRKLSCFISEGKLRWTLLATRKVFCIRKACEKMRPFYWRRNANGFYAGLRFQNKIYIRWLLLFICDIFSFLDYLCTPMINKENETRINLINLSFRRLCSAEKYLGSHLNIEVDQRVCRI